MPIGGRPRLDESGGRSAAAAPQWFANFESGYVKTPDGRVAEDAAISAGTVTVQLAAIGPCMREAVLRMRVGGVSRFMCPWPAEDGGSAAAHAPVVAEATLVAVEQPLPRPGH